MAELVVGTHADERPTRSHDPELLRRHGIVTSVMTHLQNVDVTERAVGDERTEHTRLPVTRQQRREVAFPHSQDDARLVGCSVLHASARRQNIDAEPADRERLARESLNRSAGPCEPTRLINGARGFVERTRREHDERDSHESR